MIEQLCFRAPVIEKSGATAVAISLQKVGHGLLNFWWGKTEQVPQTTLFSLGKLEQTFNHYFFVQTCAFN